MSTDWKDKCYGLAKKFYRLKKVDDRAHYIIGWKDCKNEFLKSHPIMIALAEYKSECENPVPDAIFKKLCRDKLFKAFEAATKECE